MNPSAMIEEVIKTKYINILLIAILSVIVYSNTFEVPFVFDDKPNISGNPHLDNPDFSNSRFIGKLSFAINHRLHGLDVTGYHFVNIAIHLINALLVYALTSLLLMTMTSILSAESESRRKIALLAGILFAVHPLQTQAVTYIVQRLTSLATLFYLLSVVLYACSRLPRFQRARLSYAGGLLAAVLAMKTKEIAFTLPVAIALLEFMFFEGDVKKRLAGLVPFFLTMLIIPMSFLSLDTSGGMAAGLDAATRLQTEMSRWDYLLTQFAVIATYLRLVFVPVNQNLDYDYPVYQSFFEPKVFLSFLLLAALVGLAIYLLRASDARDKRTRLIAFGIFWLFITLSVESSVIPIVDVIFEHRMYLPNAGVFIALASAIGFSLEKVRHSSIELLFILILVASTLLLSVVTFKRNEVWASDISIWTDVTTKSPNKYRPHLNLGHILAEKGMITPALDQYREAIKIDPNGFEVHLNMGNALAGIDRNVDALYHYKQALRVNYDSAKTHNNIGLLLEKMGRREEAIAHYRLALKIKIDFAEAHHNLGVALFRVGDMETAIVNLRKAIEIKPDYSIAKANLEKALAIIRQRQ